LVRQMVFHNTMTAIVLAAAQDVRPAGGAALGQIIIASTAAAVLTAGLLLLGYGHRTGRLPILGKLAMITERWSFSAGQPGWVELPSTLALFSLVTALLGMYWDVSLHIAQGRDVGPLANPAHYPIMFGLFGVFASGVLAIVLPVGERPGPAAVRITRDWYAPVGGVLLAGAGFFALLGFPFDDVWHRMFGQDVTLWGPTHLMKMIGGAGLSLVGLAVLEREGRLVRGTAEVTPLGLFVRRGMIMGDHQSRRCARRDHPDRRGRPGSYRAGRCSDRPGRRRRPAVLADDHLLAGRRPARRTPGAGR
jgi:hypothetical protein